MKAFLFGMIAAVGLAAVSAAVLQGYVQKPVNQAYSTPSTRI